MTIKDAMNDGIRGIGENIDIATDRKAPSTPIFKEFATDFHEDTDASLLFLTATPQLGQKPAPSGKGDPHSSQFDV